MEEAGGPLPGIDTVERLAVALGLAPCFLGFGIEGEDVFRQKVPGGVGRAMPPVPPAADPVQGPLLYEGLPARLAELRERRGLTRRALGRDSGTSDTTVRRVEEREIVPTIATIERLAAALAVSPCWLAFGQGQGPADTPNEEERSDE